MRTRIKQRLIIDWWVRKGFLRVALFFKYPTFVRIAEQLAKLEHSTFCLPFNGRSWHRSTTITFTLLYDHPLGAGYNPYISDNPYADVTGDKLPDIAFARIAANNFEQLRTIVTKDLNYERNPPTDPNFYKHPVTALGWQTERWFQLCSHFFYEYTWLVSGFWIHLFR